MFKTEASEVCHLNQPCCVDGLDNRKVSIIYTPFPDQSQSVRDALSFRHSDSGAQFRATELWGAVHSARKQDPQCRSQRHQQQRNQRITVTLCSSRFPIVLHACTYNAGPQDQVRPVLGP